MFYLLFIIYFQVNVISSFGHQSLPFKRITVGSTLGGIWRVASVAERVLSKRGGRAPGGGRACPALGGLSANAECWLDCLAVLVPSAVGAGVPVCTPVGLRVLRGLGRGLALLVGGGLPPRR